MKKLTAIILILICLSAINTIADPSLINYKTVNAQAEEGVKIRLTLGGKTYDLQSYSLNYYRPEKAAAETSNYPFGNLSNTITISIRSSKIDQDLLDWILAAEPVAKDGQIVVSDAESGKVLRTVTFTGTKSASYNENHMVNNYNMNSLQNTSFSLRYKTISVKFN